MKNNVHMTWFGGEIPNKIKQNMEIWKKHYPNLKIWTDKDVKKEWKTDFVVGKHPAIINDYYRLKILEEFGGFWIPASTQYISKPLEYIEEKNVDFAVAQESWYEIGCSFIFAKKNSPILRDALKFYDLKPQKFHTGNRVLRYLLLKYHINGLNEKIVDSKKYGRILICSFVEFYAKTKDSKLVVNSMATWTKGGNDKHKRQIEKTILNGKRNLEFMHCLISMFLLGNLRFIPILSSYVRFRVIGKNDLNNIRKIQRKKV